MDKSKNHPESFEKNLMLSTFCSIKFFVKLIHIEKKNAKLFITVMYKNSCFGGRHFEFQLTNYHIF